MKCLLLLANGFEDHEALTTRDVLLRSNIQVDTASITKTKVVTSSHDLILYTDYILEEINYEDYGCLILPGGKKGVTEGLSNLYNLKDMLKHFANGKLIAAICAAPSLLGMNDLLINKNYTCFPGFENNFYKGHYQDKGVVIDGNIITSKSMYYTIDFALEIIKKITGHNETACLKLKGEKTN